VPESWQEHELAFFSFSNVKYRVMREVDDSTLEIYSEANYCLQCIAEKSSYYNMMGLRLMI